MAQYQEWYCSLLENVIPVVGRVSTQYKFLFIIPYQPYACSATNSIHYSLLTN